MRNFEWKDINIFISSTFNDMHAERDHLVKFVFPELREWCAERKLHLNDIDLRWGITAEDSRTRRTLGICLRDIDESRPFFLGFLGQRRGWQPEMSDIDEETQREYPGLSGRVGKRSVTEMEIEHALLDPLIRLLNDHEEQMAAAGHAFIFLRDDPFEGKLTPAQERVYTNRGEAREGEDPATSEKVRKADEDLRLFRARLEAEFPDTMHYQCVFDPSVPSPELGGRDTEAGRGRLTGFESGGVPLRDIIIDRFKKAILSEYPDRAESVLDEAYEAADRERYLERMADGYISRPDDLEALRAYVSGTEGRPLIVHAPSGSGKTMLFTAFYRECRERPDLRAVIRCCGVGNDTMTPFDVFGGIFAELGLPVPPDMGHLKANFSASLNLLRDGKTVILIDALDQIPGGPDIPDWIPASLPENVRLIFSIRSESLSGELSAAAMEEKGFPLYQVKPFASREDKKAILDAYLHSHLKHLEDDQMEILFRKKGSANPLYLIAAASELRLVGKFEMLDRFLEQFGDHPEDIFNAMLERMENDYLSENIDSRKVVSLLFSLLSVSRYGLLREELEAVFAEAFPETDARELSGQIQAYLRQVREFLLQYGNHTDVRYYSLRRAAAERYREQAAFSHARIAVYFLEKMGPDFSGADERAAREAVWHLFHADAETAFLLLTDLRFLRKKIALCGVSSLIEDFNFAEGCKDLSPRSRRQASLIADALQKSAYLLAKNPEELPGQLALRLGKDPDDDTDAILRRFCGYMNEPWLHTLNMNEGNSDYTVLREKQDKVFALFDGPEGILTVEADGAVKVLSREDGSLVKTIRGEGLTVKCACMADGRLYLADDRGTLYAYHLITAAPAGSAELPGVPYAMDTDGDCLFIAERGENVYCLDAGTLEVRAKQRFPGGIECLLAEEDDLLLGGRNGKIWRCEKKTLEVLQVFEPEIGLLTALAADSGHIYAGGFRTLLRIGKTDGEIIGYEYEYQEGFTFIFSVMKNGNSVITFDGNLALVFSEDLKRKRTAEGIAQSFRLTADAGNKIFFVTVDHRFGWTYRKDLLWDAQTRRTDRPGGICLLNNTAFLWQRRSGFQLYERRGLREITSRDADSPEVYSVQSAVSTGTKFLAGTTLGSLYEIDRAGRTRGLYAQPATNLSALKFLACNQKYAVFVGHRGMSLLDLEKFGQSGNTKKTLAPDKTGAISYLFEPGRIGALLIDQDCFYYVSGAEVTVCRLPDGEKLRRFEIREKPVKVILDGDLLCASYPDKVLAYDKNSGEPRGEIYQGSLLDFVKHGDLFAAALPDLTIRVCHKGVFSSCLTLDDIPCVLAYDPEKNELFAGTKRGSLLKMTPEHTERAQTSAAEPPKPEKEAVPWKYEARLPEKNGNAKKQYTICRVVSILFSVIGFLVYHGVVKSIHPDVYAVLTLKNFWKALFDSSMRGKNVQPLLDSSQLKGLPFPYGIVELGPIVMALRWFRKRPRDDMGRASWFSDESFCLPSAFSWTAASGFYCALMLILSAKGESGAIIRTQIIWAVLWIIQMLIRIIYHIARKEEYGPRAGFRIRERWVNLTAAVSAAVMAVLMILGIF